MKNYLLILIYLVSWQKMLLVTDSGRIPIHSNGPVSYVRSAYGVEIETQSVHVASQEEVLQLQEVLLESPYISGIQVELWNDPLKKKDVDNNCFGVGKSILCGGKK